MCLIPLKPQFNVLLSGKNPSKLALGKISYVIFCKLAKIMKQVDNVRQGVSLFDVKPKHFNHSSLLAYTSQIIDFLYEAL